MDVIGKALKRYRFEIILSLILIISVAARVWQITGFSEDYDEGAHLMQAWLLSQGYQLYREIFFPLPPLLIQPLAWLFYITGPSTLAARLLEVSCAGLGLVALAYIGRKLWDERVALLAVILLSLADHYFRLSRISLGNVPALGFSLVALCAGIYYLERGRWFWLIIAGLSASISLLIKPLAVATPLLLMGLIFVRYLRLPEQRLKLSRDLGILAIGFLVPFIGILLAYDIPMMIEQVVHLRYRSEQVENQGIMTNLEMMQEYLTDNPGWVGLSLFGLVPARPTRQGLHSVRAESKIGNWLLLVWLGLTLFPLLQFETLHHHHLIVLEPPLALLGALAFFWVVRIVTPLRYPGLLGGAGFLVLIFYLGTLPVLLEDRLSDKPRGVNFPETRSQWAAVKLLRQVTTPQQFVVSDDLAIPFEAGRRVPPRLSDPSRVVIQAGYLTDELAVQVANWKQVDAVVFWTERFQEHLPDFTHWTSSNFRQRATFEEDEVIYFDHYPKRSVRSPQ